MRLLILALLFLSSCNFAPTYRRPYMQMPESWRVDDPEYNPCYLANYDWWLQLQDPILDGLIVQALQNNKDMQRAAWRVSDYYAKFEIVRSKLLPEINQSASAMRIRYPDQTSIFPLLGFQPIQSIYSFSFTLDYEIDLWGKLRNLTKAAAANLLASVEHRKQVVLTLVSSVAQAYILLRQFDKELEIANKTLAERQEYLRLATLRFKGGLTSEIEVEQALSALQDTEAAVVTLNKLIPLQENLLCLLLGANPSCITRGVALDQFFLPPEIPTSLPCDLLVQRPDILEIENKLIAANANIGAARAAFFPQVSLTALFGGSSFELNSLFSKSSQAWDVGGSYLLPLFTGGRLIGQLHLTEAEKMELVFSYEQTILQALKEVNDALVSHRQAKALVEVEKIQVSAASEYLRLSWLRYYDGETDYLTVLDAERKLFDSQIALTKAEGEVFLTLVDIYKSLGGGWVSQADCIRIGNSPYADW